MKYLLFLTAALVMSNQLFCQRTDSTKQVKVSDSILQEVTVEAFNANIQWKAVPAAIAIIGSKEMNRYAPVSLVPVFNTIPGVRMEERSPASYRLSVRGSLLRSPFGVRNIKVYWNGIPLTDGGGNTYLNLVDINELTGAEIIKGPAASVYGAGTGGALLLRSALPFSSSSGNRFTAGITGGSYGLFSQQAGWNYHANHFTSSLQQIHQQSDGYREQSASRKDVIKWQSSLRWKKQQLQFLFFYTDLYYQTPGGITLAQMMANPKLSRQPAGALPGAIQQKTAIYNKTFFAGVHHETELGEHFTLQSFVTANNTSFTNPFITNYERRKEDNFGIGTKLVFRSKNFQWMNGAEWLYNHSEINNFGNRSGVADTVQFKDNVFANQWFAFSQMQYLLGDSWNFTAGMSINNQSYRYKRLTDPASLYADKRITAVITPRFAVLYRISRNISAYIVAAKGFSPPALAEVRPSDGNFYGNLQAESGWNFEAGIKGELPGQRIQFDVAGYFFKLRNAIVRRNNAAGAEYFVNAGGTQQKGIEAILKYQAIKKEKSWITGLNIWSSISYQPYRFENYQQSTSNYSGNELTGVPRNSWVSGIDMETVKGFYLNASINCTSSLPLTDANDAYANAYQLMQVKFGYHCRQKQNQLTIFAGVDNLFNQNYSLGNDINAAGKRYYNPAAGRNVFAGLQFQF